jgi:metal-dependent amidase/aminoacylase/carboxypeptidase family protein
MIRSTMSLPANGIPSVVSGRLGRRNGTSKLRTVPLRSMRSETLSRFSDLQGLCEELSCGYLALLPNGSLQFALALQTIVSRENNPLDPVVITVGTIHGGTKNSIIPDEVKLQLTVRTYKPEVRKRVLASIERVAKGEALAGGAPKQPLVKVTPAANAMYNDPALTKRLVATLRLVLGPANVVEVEPTMVFEDFAEFNLAGIPSADFWVGAVKPENFVAAQQSGTPLTQLHSAAWAPDYAPTLKMAMTVETTELLELLGH